MNRTIILLFVLVLFTSLLVIGYDTEPECIFTVLFLPPCTFLLTGYIVHTEIFKLSSVLLLCISLRAPPLPM
ncbi:MAG: hypothetical protein JXB48_01035 [Candidatus Latescibacteria bacterium]|nr:hypothetical protein [Candidatus Latescibacterota bacterium]